MMPSALKKQNDESCHGSLNASIESSSIVMGNNLGGGYRASGELAGFNALRQDSSNQLAKIDAAGAAALCSDNVGGDL
jgi:hypothetical protein